MFAIHKFADVVLSFVLIVFIVTLSGCQSAGPKSATAREKSAMEDYKKSSPCEINTGEAALRAEQHQVQNSHLIRGEVTEVDGSNYLVKEQEGRQVRLKTDETTAQPVIQQGQRIEASVNEQNQVLWIRTDNSTDRRNEHAASDCASN